MVFTRATNANPHSLDCSIRHDIDPAAKYHDLPRRFFDSNFFGFFFFSCWVLFYIYWFITSSLTAGKRAQRDTVLTVEVTCVPSWYTTRMPRRERESRLLLSCLKLKENGNSQFRGPLFVIKPFFATRRRRTKRDMGALFSVKQ